MKKKRFHKLNERGDTIIEVMIVLAILGLSLGISYATASSALNQSLNAQQHSTALGILNSQVELLRAAIDTNATNISTISASSTSNGPTFCMIQPSSAGAQPFVTFPPSPLVPQSAQTDAQQNYGEYPASCQTTSSITYYVSASLAPYNSGSSSYGYTTPVPYPCSGTNCEDNFTFVVRWNGIGTLGPQQESLSYRVGLTNSLGGGQYGSAP